MGSIYNLEQAYLSLESGRTSYGSGDFESGLADGAITYSDGKNSGIVIKNVGSIEGDTISFDIEFTDLSQSDYWTMDTSYESGNIQYMDSWMNDGTVYYILKNESSEAVELVQYDGTAWKKLDASLPSDGYDYKIGSYSNDIFVLTYNDTCAKLLRYTEKGWESVFTTAYVVGETALFTTKDGVYFACTDSEHKEVLVYQYTDQILQLGKQTNKAEYATNLSVGAENEQIILEYRDWKQNDKVIVKQYNESSDNWKNVGNLDISTKNSRIYVQNNMVYLIQSDNDSGYIYRYNLVTDNGTWEQYGNAFSDENIAETTMCFQSNSPYIVYQGGLSQKVYVKYLQSNQWKDLGGSATSEKIQGLNAWWSNRNIYLTYLNITNKKVCVKWHEEGSPDKNEDNKQEIVEPAIYQGIDYSDVYDYQYYIKNNSDIKKAYGDDDLAVLQHFINSGMVEGRQGKVEFNVRTYKNRYADLRKAYGNNLRKYYLHYIEHGKKEGRTGKGTSSVINPITVYNGMDYSPVYDYYYYINHNGDIKRVYGDDDIAVLRHFINSGMIEGRIASDKFNVYLYKANYPDLQKAYGNNLKAYYMHYLRNGLNEGRSGNISFAGKQSFQVKNCIVSSFDNTTLTLTLKLTKKDSSISTNEDLYVVLMNSKGSSCVELKKGNVSSGSEISVTVTFTDNDSFKAFAMGKYAIAVKKGDIYQIVSDSCMLKNPEDMARKDDGFKDKYWGYYEGYKVYSKKGIQDADDAYTKDLGVQNVLLNADIQDLVSTTKKAGYVPYTYKGTTYYFSDLIGLKNTINDLHGWGNTENGYTYGKGITRNVTLVLLMSWKHDELSYLIHPSARVKGAAPYYSLNMKDEKARNTFEALFCYMGEELGQMKTRVNNWTLGNELNSCNAWNYAGLMSLNDYVENYAQAFQIIHQAVKRTASSPRLFISLDHCWNVAEAGFSGKAFLDTFASYMNKTAPNMQWNVNFHSYSQPLSNNAFWNDKQNTTDSVSTRYISMRNISVLTNYLASLENTYGKPSGSIRVIIGELGYSSTKGGQESQQAAALGYGYYIAMANKRIDAYIIRAYVDDPVETRAGLYLGLNAVQNGKHVKKTAYEVYKYLDRKQSFDYMNKYLGLIGIKSWSSAIPGFNADEIVAGEKMFQ